MLRSYHDITDRLGDPLWWDDNGVPRYAPYEPGLQGVYIDMAVLMKIECQSCQREFLVGMTSGQMERIEWGVDEDPPRPTVSPEGFHYGDPPNHNCTGDTMNSIPRRVIQYHTRGSGKKVFDGWVRDHSEEIDITPKWASSK